MKKQERYALDADDEFMVFEFISTGPRGEISKLIQYSQTEKKNIYNLGFGDKDLETGSFDDQVISNNGDSQKILATVAETVYTFTEQYPGVRIFATGSTRARTRLYRIGITNNLTEILQDFELYGLRNGKWEEFSKGVEYQAFLVKRR